MPTTTTPALPTGADVQAAAQRIAGQVVRTPLLENAALNARVGGRVLLKLETLQTTGSFKFRGASNALMQIPQARRAAGVVAYSSGNHAQGVAAAAQRLGMPATIVMPADAPAIKRANTEAYGARVVPYDRTTEDRMAIASEIAAQSGAAIIPPYDHAHVIAGQGTCGLEIVEQCRAQGVAPDAVLVCCGGGGLTAGVTLALETEGSSARVHPVEPAGFDDWARSLSAGTRLGNAAGASSLCDALMTPMPGELTFAVNHGRLAPGLVVDDDAVLDAIAFAFRVLKLVIEPGGAVTLAAVLAGKLPTAGRTIACVVSGGNVDPAVFSRALARA